MSEDHSAGADQLPYRSCVGVMLLNNRGLVWIGRRIPKNHDKTQNNFIWQMPQGGIDAGEQPRQAALRELEEEVGTQEAEIIAESKTWLTYDLPPDMVGKALKGRYRGQKQKWFVMRYQGSDDGFALDGQGKHRPEFDAWRWEQIDQLPKLIVPFKRPVYEQLVQEFSALCRAMG